MTKLTVQPCFDQKEQNEKSGKRCITNKNLYGIGYESEIVQ